MESQEDYAILNEKRLVGIIFKAGWRDRIHLREGYDMTKSEFLAQLKTALQGNVSSRTVQENMEFYDQYIIEETAKGKSEQEVLSALGDPWILARTITDANDGTDQETVYESEGSAYYSGREGGERGRQPGVHVFGLDTWWKKLLLILAVVMVVLLIFSIISGLVSLFAPIIIPVLIVMFVVRLFGGRRS